MKNKKIIIVLIIILLIVVVIISAILASINKKNKSMDNTNVVIDTRTEEEKEDEKLQKIKKASESERLKIYIGTYFNYIENNELDKAYDLLYPEFKENYFPTLEDYKKYISEKNYPQLLAIDYGLIRTQGKYYIVELSISDFTKSDERDSIEEQLILIENDYNDYYISFKK